VSVSTTNDQFTDRTALLDMAGGGRYVGFFAYDSNAVFVRDTSAGRTERIDVDSNEQAGSADLYSWGASLSGNGRYVAFESDAHLAPGDGDRRDVFLRDRVAGTTSVISVDSNEQPLVSEEGPHASNETPVISGNGRYVAFASGYCPAVEGGGRLGASSTCAGHPAG
jgi:Tol biopolymer transport system component